LPSQLALLGNPCFHSQAVAAAWIAFAGIIDPYQLDISCIALLHTIEELLHQIHRMVSSQFQSLVASFLVTASTLRAI
jgi:hypothetical protein